MGGVEEAEPPHKRVKTRSIDLEKKPLHNLSTAALVSLSSGDSMARMLSSKEDNETIGPKGVIKKHEFVKIITRALYSLGYERTGALLQEESGIQLSTPPVDLFIQQLESGKWEESLATLHTIGLDDMSIMKSISFLILEQKLLQNLREEKHMEALNTLRNEIVPLSVNTARVHELSANILSPLPILSLGSESRSSFIENLKKLLPATIIVPERRLEHLLEQALDMQQTDCALHNTLNMEMSLLTDHRCGSSNIPSQTVQVLDAHKNEVWFLQFSHNGRYLASSSKDRLAVIWEVRNDNQVVLKHKLAGHQKPVLTVSFSPDDAQLLTCGLEEVIKRWDVTSGECLYTYEKQGVVSLVSCGWFPDGKGIVSGMTDKSICLWDLDGKVLESWRGQKTIIISDMAITDDWKLISICRDTAILLLDREAKFERLIEEDEVITSFSLSKDNKYLLVNLINQELHLWRIEDDDVYRVCKYKGHTRTRFLIRSCFGGLNQAFVASGSEDSQVYIWHKETGELLRTLPGHSGAVNCVSWNPKNPQMLASASDDRTIRIWGVNDLKNVGSPRNGNLQHENGNVEL